MDYRAMVIIAILNNIYHPNDAELIVIPRDTEVKINDSTYMNCSASLQANQIQWRHGNYYVYTGIAILEPYNDGRFSIEINASTGASNLVIQSVRPTDAGKYECTEDEGFGEKSTAELIVLDNDPDCQSNIQPDGVIGQNIFNIPQDEVHLTCTVTYHGNIAPQLEWKKVEGDRSTKDSAPSYNISSNNRLIKYTLKLKGDISLDKSSYVCQTTRVTQKQFNCTSKVIKVLYSLNGNTIEKDVVRGNDITCIIKNNTFPCKNQWYNGNDSFPLSSDETITAHLLGEYKCTVKCHIRGTEYLFTALKAYAVEATSPPPSLSGIITAFVLVPVVIIALIGIFIKFYRYIKRKQIERKLEEEEQRRLLEHKDEEERLKKLGLILTIRTKAAAEEKKLIYGLTILDKELFVVNEESSEVEVYDSIKLSFSRRWNLETLINPHDIVSCDRNKCLYISHIRDGHQSREILRADSNGKLIRKWSTKDEYGQLSVTYESNIILAALAKNKLNEYSPEGLLVREINLSPEEGFSHPQHAIKLANGQFVVSHGMYDDDYDDTLHRVCIVDVDGKLLKSFGGKPGSTTTQMNLPNYLSVNGNEFVIVADSNNSRVLLLDSDLTFNKEILTEEHGLQYPEMILLDESTDRLFVADNDSDDTRILIFNYNEERGIFT